MLLGSGRGGDSRSVSAFLLNRFSDLSAFHDETGRLNVHPVNIQTACLIMEGAEFTENIINGVERPVKAAELFEIGRASCRERVEISEVAVSLKKKCYYIDE